MVFKGKYNTLSHCWGLGNFLQLNQSTNTALESGLPINELPQMFQDAIYVCQCLEVRYIWIDSLCIQQDDPCDWLEESKCMGMIYSSAYCNISADACSSSTEGLLRNQDHSTLPKFSVKVPHSWRPQRMPGGNYDLLDVDYLRKQLDDAPLNKRAWVLQERVLARRILHFTKHEIIWECRSVIASETWPSSIFGRHTSWLKAPMMPQHHAIDLSIDRISYNRTYEYWGAIQSLYSSTDITFPDDRLVAISGIAKAFEKLLDDTYVAGLWKSSMLTDLLWRCPGEQPRIAHTVRKFQPPSFSWLSLETTVFPGLSMADNIRRLAEFLTVDVQHVSDDKTGLVHGGELRLIGRLREVSLSWFNARALPSWIISMEDTSMLGCKAFADLGRVDLPRNSAVGQHYFFPIAVQDSPNGFKVFGLIIELYCSNSRKYRRIGMFETEISKNQRWYLDRQPDEEHYPCEEYDEETSQHTICIQ